MKSVEEIKKGLKNQSSNAKKSADAVKAGLVKNKIISDVNSLSASAQNNEGYSSLKSKATEIDNMLLRYRKYYDNDFISSVDSTISSTLKNSKKSIDVADALSNTDANNDGTVDLKDLVRAKKNENTSSTEVKEIKKLTTDEIKKELLSPEYTKERILKKAVEDAKKVYEEAKKTDDRSFVMKGLDFIGGVPNSVSNAKEDYEAKKKEYETHVAENTEKRIQKQYGVTGAEYIESLKQQKKNAKTDSEKESISAKLKSTREKLYGETNVFKHIGNIAKEGVLLVEKGIAASFDFVLGNAAKALGFENNPFTMTNEDYTNRLKNANAETVKSSKAFGDDDNLTGQAGTAIVAAIPDMLISLLTAGSSTTAKGAQLGSKAIANANPTFLYNLQQGVEETVKSPIYYTSFIRELGTNYEDALANGATEEQATLVALFTSTVNSRIEMGGMQALPDELVNTKGFGKKVLKWLTSSADEGLEEVKQGAVSKLTDKAFYDYDKEVYSNTDSNAIIHPSSMGQEFAMGTLVGAVLGGGQLTFNGIIQANNDSQYKNIGKFVSKTNNVQELIDYGKSAVNDDIRVLARTVNAENITDADIGRLYQYAVRDITEKFDDVYTERDFETIVNEYFSGNVSESIKNIASATFANKLMEMNIEPEQNSTYKAFNENIDLQSTTNAISNPLSSYSSERQGVIRSFLNSVDEKLKSFVQSVKNGDTTFRREKISDVSDRAVSDIKNLLGIDVSGYTNNINTSGIEHILKRHGEKGHHDSSMSSADDIARVGWILDNYDSVELLTKDGKQVYSKGFLDKNGELAPQIRFVKKIDGTYYVVEAVCENEYKKLWVQSVYLQKNNEDVTETHDADIKSPRTTPENASLSPSSNPNIPQNGNGVNNNISTEAENNSQNGNGSGIIKGKPSRGPLNKAEQDYILKVAKALGREVKFVHLYDELKAMGKDVSNGIPDGAFDNRTGVIYIDFAAKAPFSFVFKHELTHFLESNQFKYYDMANAIMDSEVFKEWIHSMGYNSVSEYNAALIEQYSKINKKFGEHDANLEIVANFVGSHLFGDSTKIERLVESLNPVERNKFVQFIIDFITSIREKLKGDTKINAELKALEDQYIALLKEVSTEKNTTATNGGGVQFIVNQENNSSIKQQLTEHKDEINAIGVVFNQRISAELNSKQEAVEWVLSRLGNDANTVKRDGFGEIVLDKKRIKNGMSYLKTKEEIFAFAAVPQVLKNGIEIASHSNHKGRNYDTITFAAPVVINAQRGNMAVVVRQEDKNYYKVHRLLMPDGSQFVFDEKRDTAETAGGVDNNSGLSPTDNVSTDSIPDNQESVNNNSMQKSGNNSKNDLQFSFGLETRQKKIDKAEELERKGANRHEIWNKVRIIRDAKGKWVREINDKYMVFRRDGDAAIMNDPDYDEYIALKKRSYLSDEDYKKLGRIDQKFKRKYLYGENIVGNYVQHDELFKLYPQLYGLQIEFEDLGSTYGKYVSEERKIVINKSLIDNEFWYDLETTIMHELQHAIQDIDERANGASIEYWSKRAARGDIPLDENGKPLSPRKAYENTAGEIEARHTESRKSMSDYKRKKNVPDFGWDKAVFVEEKYNLVPSVQYSIPSNTDYISAVESGDLETAQRMTDEAAKAAGYTERLYHQTGADFTEFNTENQKAGKYDWELPTGTFLKPTSDDIGLSGKKQMELYAKFQNPLKFKNRAEAQKFWKENVEGYAEAVNGLKKVNAEYREKVDNAEAEVQQYINQWRNENPDASRREIYNDPDFQKLYDKQQDIVDEWDKAEGEASTKAKELIDSFIAENDYDGIILERDDDGKNRHTKSYIAFESAQMKSAEAVTYDDSGNVIPLGERFNAEKSDIRYSVPTLQDPEMLLERYENGEITRAEYLNALKKEKTLNPVEIANMKVEDANTTPPLKKFKGENIGDKESNTYQSLLDSDIFDDRFKEEIEDDTWIMSYKSITNKETLKKAARELDEGGAAYVKQWDNKDPEHASLIDIAVGFILMDRYQRVGDYESAAAAAERVGVFGTASGQQVQIFSILGRLDPNTMQAYAQKTLDKAYEKLADIKTQKWLDENADKFKLTQEDIDYIRHRTLQAAMFDDNTRPKAVFLGEICARIQDKIPPEKGQSIRALQRSNMLLNPKTILRNLTGNANMAPIFIASDLFGTIIDKKVAKKTDVRTTGNFKFKGSGANLKKGLYESWDDFKRGIRTKQEDLNRFDLNVKEGKNFNEHHNGKLAKQFDALSKALNKMDNFTSFCLEVGDRPFFEMWMTNSINNQLRLNNVDIPTPEMLEVARQEALQRTWQDDNKFTRSASKIKSALNDMVHIPGTSYGLGDWVLKFIKTPSNIAKAIGSFSPVGFVSAGVNAKKLKNAIDKGKFTPQLQKEFVRSMSNAITGTLVYVLVAIGASLGILKLTGDEEEDKDASNFQKYVMGIPPYSIEFLGVNISYDWNQPFGSVLAVVADYMESRKANPEGDVANAIFEAIKAGGKVFAQQSFIQSLYDLFSSEDIIEALSTAALAEPAAFVPQRWSQTASFFDEYRRTSYDYTNSFQSAINKAIAKIPGLRTTLPKQVNVLGEDVKNTQYLDIWEAFASPWNTYPKSSSEVVGEIYDLYKSTGENSVIPKTAPNYFTVEGNKIVFTPEEKAEFQRNIGKRSAEMLALLFDNEEYSKLSNEEKVDVIGKIYQFAYDKAKSEREYDYEILSAMAGEKKNGDPSLTEAEYNKLPQKAREMIAQERFLSKTEVRYMDKPERLIQYYIKQAKE